MERDWILVGMMGSGKTTIGRAMAAASNREFIDSDFLLQHRLGHSVARLFAVYGEAAFRDHETALLRSLEPSARVLATGGGIVQREANWVEMQRLGLTIFLDVKTDILLERLDRGRYRRPLLIEEGWEQRVLDLLARRRPLYEKADIHLHLEGDDPETIARTAIEEIRRHD